MVSLGCPKTLVDSEILLGKIPRGKYSLAATIEESDVVLLNTCSFIEAAQKESLDYIRSLLKLKKERIEQLNLPNLVSEGTIVNSQRQESKPQKMGRGLASVAAVPIPALLPVEIERHDCEAARDAHIYHSEPEESLTEDDAMAQFLATTKGQTLMEEFLYTVEVPEGGRVLKIAIAEEFEKSLEHLDHDSASDEL